MPLFIDTLCIVNERLPNKEKEKGKTIMEKKKGKTKKKEKREVA